MNLNSKWILHDLNHIFWLKYQIYSLQNINSIFSNKVMEITKKQAEKLKSCKMKEERGQKNRQTDGLMDICDCRVAYVTENLKINVLF